MKSICRWKFFRMKERIRCEIPPGSIAEPQLWIKLYVKVISPWNAVSKFADNIKTGDRKDREGKINRFQFGLACFLCRTKGNGDDKCFPQMKSVRTASQRNRNHPNKYISFRTHTKVLGVNAKSIEITIKNQEVRASRDFRHPRQSMTNEA